MGSNHSQNELFDKYRFIAWKNTHSETCPPFGCFAETGTGTSGGGVYIDGTRPSSTFRRKYRFNGPYAVPQNKWGICFDSRTAIAITNGTPTADTTLGPKPDSWELWADYPSVADVVGAISVSDKTALVEWYPICHILGQISSGSLAKDSSVSMNVWHNEATPAAITGWTATIYDKFLKTGETVGTGLNIGCDFEYGKWIAKQARCA